MQLSLNVRSAKWVTNMELVSTDEIRCLQYKLINILGFHVNIVQMNKPVLFKILPKDHFNWLTLIFREND